MKPISIYFLLLCATVVRCGGFSLSETYVSNERRKRNGLSRLWNDLDEGEQHDDDLVVFEDLGVPSVLRAVWAQPDWHTPTTVQRMVIPKLVGTDSTDAAWVEAPTGSGKTATFVLPLMENLLTEQRAENGGVRSLIVCPTRELAVQIHAVVDGMTRQLSQRNDGSHKKRKAGSELLSSMVVHGGVPLKPQIERLSDFAAGAKDGNNRCLDILIATPGRLVDVLTYYDQDDGATMAQDAVLERKILEAFEQEGMVGNDRGKKSKCRRRGNAEDISLSLEQLERLGLDSILSSSTASSATSLGASSPEKRRQLKRDDGRLCLHTLLNGLDFLIVDEADRMLGNAFRGDLDNLLDLILPSNPPPKTWLFSATFPKAIEPRLDQVLRKMGVQSPVRFQVDDKSFETTEQTSEEENISASLQKKLERSSTVASASRYQQVGDASTIQLRTIRLDRPARTQALKQLLQDGGIGHGNNQQLSDDVGPSLHRVLVFVATRYATELVSRKLQRAGIPSNELHGKLDQDARIRRLEYLQKGKINVLVATDLAARGIDIKNVDLVVQYDLPRSTSEWVHRNGRTGRAGRVGTAVSFVTAETEAQMDLIESRHFRGRVGIPERETIVGYEPDETKWKIEADGSRVVSAHDRMFGGIKGRRKSKKDKLREQAAQLHSAQPHDSSKD